MRHPTRDFKAEACELEGRLLMASTPPTLAGTVRWLHRVWGDYTVAIIQVVTQQAGEATVTLSRTDTAGSLQVEVTTTRYPGVNVGAVDQTVTFAPGQSLATVTVPIIAGAPNPGVVDAALVINPSTPQIPARQCSASARWI